jgi:hypothetical protein
MKQNSRKIDLRTEFGAWNDRRGQQGWCTREQKQRHKFEEWTDA